MDLRDQRFLTRTLGLVAAVMVLGFVAAPAGAATIRVALDFDQPTLSPQQDGSVLVEAPGCVTFNDPGLPLLPAHPAVVLLPPGETISAVRVIPEGEHAIPGIHRVTSAETPRPISAIGPFAPTAPDQAVYGSNAVYPPEAARLVTEQMAWGHGLGFMRVFPVAYRPLTGELIWYERVTIEVETELSATSVPGVVPNLRNSDHAIQRLNEMVMNPEDLYLYEGSEAADLTWSRITPDYYPYVIITTQAMAATFQPLVDFEMTRGLRARIMTVEQIRAEYTGIDVPQQIRNFVIDAYNNWQTEYVMLGGDHDVVDERDLYVNAGGTVDNFPGDCYFEGLDGSWNTDGDNRWGEPGEEDLVGEIAVGRASVNNATEFNNWFHKNQMYTESPVSSQILKALFIGEQLDGSTYGDDSMDDVKDGSSDCGYTTVGYPATYTKTTLYDRVGWTKYDLINRINEGYPTTHHLGHANTTYVMKMDSPDVALLTNDGVTASYMFNYSQGCYCGEFDNTGTDCIVEAFVNDAHGSAAFIANSRYGWYMPGTACGPSQPFERQLVDARFAESFTTAGWLNVDSKADCVWMLDEYTRWCHYELCLLGDPAMPQWARMAGNLAMAHSGVYVIGQGNYQVTVTDGTNPAAGVTVTMYSSDYAVWVSGVTNLSGIVQLDPGDVTPMTLNLKAVKADYRPATDDLQVVPASGPYLMVDEVRYTGGGDALVNAGETVALGLCLRNAGSENATGVSATLGEEDEFVNFTVSSQTFPDIPAGGEGWGNGSYMFTVAADCPDMHPVTVTVTITADDRPVWNGDFTFFVHAPDMSIYALLVDDSVGGDGDLHIEAGETATVTLTLLNAGSGALNNITGVLSCPHPRVTITSNTGTHPGLGEDQTGALTPPFQISVDEAFGYDETTFNLALTGSNSYDQDFDVPLPCGGFFETVEAGAGMWTHYMAGGAFVDQWHVSTERNHTPGGTRSWKCGDSGTGQYAPLLNAALETPEVEIAETGVAELFMWHWIEAEVSGSYPDHCYDGGLAEMSVDGGPWQQITPDGGYPYLIRAGSTPGPFPAETPVFSGSHGWQQERFDLSAVSGMVKFRFRFGSDGADQMEGWHIDDVQICGLGGLSGAGDVTPTWTKLELFPSRPNPTAGMSQIALAMPQNGTARLEVFDAGGRLVNTLFKGEMPAGYHVMTWSGCDDRGRAVASGMYYFRLSTDQGVTERKTILVR